ncbi:DUF3977 family protein [Paenibacillus pinihumi]|uniref:DUF3977 family protein n=1 Tax=Paenibacillus pinihumi TaxID=669462 RepID=UPI0003FFF451|nr:DUF3977 family protein [Paenibacillus pinihumi]
MKFIEFGIGNRWLIRTETELSDGTEFEERGITGPVIFQSVYIRIWIGKTVWIADWKEGLKRSTKQRRAFKLIIGVVSR